ncbi:MAG: hypothetical protein HY304_02675 [candidate division Zixibacteria bacterium]|nr:hypothetical protein [candidate division Zixibacteria bacterium]
MIRVALRVLLTTAAVACIASVATAVPIPPNVPVTGALPNRQNEEQAWICPTDTNIIVTNHRDFRLGYRQIGLGRSIDGGASWTDSLIKPGYQIFPWQSDPVMTVNNAGDFIICHLDFDPNGNNNLSLAAFLVSHDKGLTWNGPTTVEPDPGEYFEDKQFITCDRTGGLYEGNIYISWTRFYSASPNKMVFARSTNNALTFDDTIPVGPSFTTTCAGGPFDAGQFSQPLVGKDGAIYVFWMGYDVDSSAGCAIYDAIRVNKSVDGGTTWQGDKYIHHVDGWNTAAGSIGIYSMPVTDADIGSGPHAGSLYLQYRDTVPGPPHNSDIVFQRSLDTGHTWSPPYRVNDDPTGVAVDQFHNWMVCNKDGYLASIWYDQRTDPAHFKFDVFAAYSYDGGTTWTSNHRVSSVSIDPGRLAIASSEAIAQGYVPPVPVVGGVLTPLAGRIAEYIALSCVGDKLVAVWTDTRVADQDVYSAHWYLPLTDPRLIYPLAGETVDSTAPGLLWATAWKETEDLYRLQISSDPGFGSTVRDQFVSATTFNDPLTGVGPGLYYWRLKAYKVPGGVPAESTVFSAPGSFRLAAPPCVCTCHADPMCDGQTDILDVVGVVNAAFRGQPAQVDAGCPKSREDVDCNGVVDVLDVVKMVNVAFRGANAATEFCDPCA